MENNIFSEEELLQLSQKVSLPGIKIEPLPSGFNNHALRIIKDNQIFCLKKYDLNPEDKRERFKTETLFLEFASKQGISNIPKILLKSEQYKIILFDFVDGEHFTSSDINDETLKLAFDLIDQLNSKQNQNTDLPLASEACFSLNEHLNLIANRVKRLNDLSEHASPLYEEYHQIRSKIFRYFEKYQADLSFSNLDHIITQKDRIVSPSDFGFHNALKSKKEKIIWLDWEYAGWDDPAKMICDFFCQPAVPVPEKYKTEFIDQVAKLVQNKEDFKERCFALFPFYQVKWLCILLNDFLIGYEKRLTDQDEPLEYLKEQIQKANQYLKRLN